MPDLYKIKRNVAKMASMQAPPEEIDSYLSQEGVSAEDIQSIPLAEALAASQTQVSPQGEVSTASQMPQQAQPVPSLTPEQIGMLKQANIPASDYNKVMFEPQYNTFKGMKVPSGQSKISYKPQYINKVSSGTNDDIDNTRMFLKQFERSESEIYKKFPKAGEANATGKGSRMWADLVSKNLGELPETSAFLKELQPMANLMARTIEGGKITDQDRKIYADSFANAIQESSQTNVRLVSNSLLRMHNKGGNIAPLLKELNTSSSKTIQNIVKETLKDAPELDKLVNDSIKMTPDLQKAMKAAGITGTVKSIKRID